MYMAFLLGGGSSERRLRPVLLRAFTEQFWYQLNSKRDPNVGKYAKKLAVLRWTASAHYSFYDEVVGYGHLSGHCLNKFVKLILLRPITLSEYFIYNLFATKAETCACQSTERWFNDSLRIQPFLLDPGRQGRFKEKGLYSQASLIRDLASPEMAENRQLPRLAVFCIWFGSF